MTTEVEISDCSTELNGPVSAERLTTILNDALGKDEPVQASIESVVKHLNESSSKHKFIVNATTLEANSVENADFSIDNYVGSSWNAKSDGVFHCQLKKGDHTTVLVSVFWIAV
ncbi:Tda2p [Kluyveromyces marxianus]|nr:Tda2p [Kluyveromyces marxianus]